MSKVYTNTIVSVESAKVAFNVEGNGRFQKASIVTTEDGKQGVINNSVNDGGLVMGSNSRNKNLLHTAHTMMRGASLADAITKNYTINGIKRIEGVDYPYGRDHAFKVEETAETVTVYWYNFSRTDKKYWEKAFAFKKTAKVPTMGIKPKAVAIRKSGMVYQTTGEDDSRNASINDVRRHGGLK